MSDKEKCSSRDFGDSFQLTNRILDSGETRHMMPQISNFIPGSLEDRDKHIEVTDGHQVTANQKGQSPIKCVMITEILLLQHCATYFWHHIYVTGFSHYWVNEFGTYLFISPRVLHGVLCIKREKYGYLAK